MPQLNNSLRKNSHRVMKICRILMENGIAPARAIWIINSNDVINYIINCEGNLNGEKDDEIVQDIIVVLNQFTDIWKKSIPREEGITEENFDFESKEIARTIVEVAMRIINAKEDAGC